MALIICPECKKEISDTCENCIHCGYKLINSSENITSPGLTTYKVEDDDYNNQNDLTTMQINDTYDVLLIDSIHSLNESYRILQNYLNCSLADARKIFNNLPAYLYIDISKNDAIGIAKILQNQGMCIAIIDQYGKETYYYPYNYNKRIDFNFGNLNRNPFLEILPTLLFANSLRRMTSRALTSTPRRIMNNSSYRNGSNFFKGPGSKRR